MIIPTKLLIMKKVLFFLSVFFISLINQSCTNDEGDEDIDVITPPEQEEIVNS